MKLLFDENLSPKLPNRLSDLFPNSLHVRDVVIQEIAETDWGFSGMLTDEWKKQQ